jgi:diguanylate cyclase (GGDEF)-like protein
MADGRSTLLASHAERIRALYGHAPFEYSQVRILAVLLASALVICVGDALAYLLAPPTLVRREAGLFFVVVLAPVVSLVVMGYYWLLRGQLRRVRAAASSAVLIGVALILIFTGGFPDSPASALVILPPVILYCILGVRAGLCAAVATPALVALDWSLRRWGVLSLPSFASYVSAEFNAITIIGATYLFAVVTVAAYAHSNLRLSAELEAERARHSRLALLDELTGLANSRSFERGLEALRGEDGSAARPMAAIFCDLDRFKPINDAFGHAAGDHVLISVAQRLREAMAGEAFMIARLGGDEFVVLLTEARAQAVVRTAARIRPLIEEPISYEGVDLRVGVSVGWALGGPGDGSPAEIVRRADHDMYRRKHRQARRGRAA